MTELQKKANEYKELLNLYPNGTHFHSSEKIPGYAFNNEDLLKMIEGYEKLIRIAAGYISTTDGFTDMHPQEVEQKLYYWAEDKPKCDFYDNPCGHDPYPAKEEK